MPKLNIALKPSRVRENLEYTVCAVCSGRTFEIDQNKCVACGKYLCFGCAALRRIYCCEGYVKRFWFGFMDRECRRFIKATEEGNRKRLKRALADFGTNCTIQQVFEEIERYKLVGPVERLRR